MSKPSRKSSDVVRNPRFFVEREIYNSIRSVQDASVKDEFESALTYTSLTDKPDLDAIIAFMRDSNKETSKIVHEFIGKRNEISRKLKKELYADVSTTKYREDMVMSGVNIITSSLMTIICDSRINIFALHESLFGEDIKYLHKSREIIHESSYANYAQTARQMQSFLLSSPVEGAPLYSLILNCFDLNAVLERVDSNKATIQGVTVEELINSKNCNLLLKKLCAKLHLVLDKAFKRTTDVTVVNVVNALETLPSSLHATGVRFCASKQVERYLLNYMFIFIASKFGYATLLELINDQNFRERVFVYTSFFNEDDTTSFFDDFIGRCEGAVGILPEKLYTKLNEKRTGTMSVDFLSNGLITRINSIYPEKKFTTLFAPCDLTSSLLETTSKVKSFMENKKLTVNKIKDNEEVTFEFIAMLMSNFASKATEYGFISKLVEEEEGKLEQIMSMESLLARLNSILPYINDTGIHEVYNKSILNVNSKINTILNYTEKHNIKDEYIYLLMVMLDSVCIDLNTHVSDLASNNRYSDVAEHTLLNNHNQNVTESLTELEKENIELKNRLQKQKESFEKELESKLSQVNLENNKLERQVSNLKEEISTLKDDLKEGKDDCNEMRKNYFDLLSRMNEADTTDVSEKLAYLQTKRISLIGGYPPLMAQFKNNFNSSPILEKSSPSNNYSQLENCDFNIVYTPAMSHGLLYALKKNTSFDKRYILVDKDKTFNSLITYVYDKIKEIELDNKRAIINSNPLD